MGDVYLMRGCWGPSVGQQLQQDNGTHSGFLLAVTDTAALFVEGASESGLEFQPGQEPKRQSYTVTVRKILKRSNKHLCVEFEVEFM